MSEYGNPKYMSYPVAYSASEAKADVAIETQLQALQSELLKKIGYINEDISIIEKNVRPYVRPIPEQAQQVVGTNSIPFPSDPRSPLENWLADISYELSRIDERLMSVNRGL